MTIRRVDSTSHYRYVKHKWLRVTDTALTPDSTLVETIADPTGVLAAVAGSVSPRVWEMSATVTIGNDYIKQTGLRRAHGYWIYLTSGAEIVLNLRHYKETVNPLDPFGPPLISYPTSLQLTVATDTVSATGGYTASGVSANRWHQIEVDYTAATTTSSSDGAIHVYIDNNHVINQPGIQTGNSDGWNVLYRYEFNGGGATAYVTSLYEADARETPMGIRAYFPDGTGVFEEFDPGGGNYNRINNYPEDSGSAVTGPPTGEGGSQDNYTVTTAIDLPLDEGVPAVAANIYVKRVGSAPASLEFMQLGAYNGSTSMRLFDPGATLNFRIYGDGSEHHIEQMCTIYNQFSTATAWGPTDFDGSIEFWMTAANDDDNPTWDILQYAVEIAVGGLPPAPPVTMTHGYAWVA